MRKFLYIILATVMSFCSCSSFDDGDLRGRVNDFKQRMEQLKEKAAELSKQVSVLSEITNGNVITSVSEDSDGKYVITYKDNADKSHTVIIATGDQIIDIPIISVQLFEGAYYWVQVVDSQSEWLTDQGGNKIPVSGYTPTISVNDQGYWTIDGKPVVGSDGKPVEANTDATSIFKGAELNAEGNLVLTLGNGEVVTLSVFQSLNLMLDLKGAVNVADVSKSITFGYDLSGAASSVALVDIAQADGVRATIDRATKKITVSFDALFTSGRLIVFAYDLDRNTIVRPLYFKSSVGPTIINSAQQLVEFANGVNDGSQANAHVELGANIDMSSVASWTPIGNGTFTWAGNVLTTSGPAFKGIFDGNGYAIRNLRLVCTNAVAGGVYGLFGVLNGATVRNLTIGAASGDVGSLTVSATASVDAGVIAGLVNESTVENCTSYIPMLYNGTSTGRVTMGMVGFIFSKDKSTSLNGLVNRGSITAGSTGNTTNGATAVQVAGIAGFATNDLNSTVSNTISYCDNYGTMTSAAPRTSGILAAANRYTVLSSCVNHGHQTNSFATVGGSRPGNITCITGIGSSLSDCINNGNLISTTAGRCGGIVSLPSHVTSTFDGCENYGEIITDDSNRGVFFGYNSVASTWIGCVAGGKVGLYNNGTYLYDEYPDASKISYLGAQGATKATTSNITYMIGSSEGGGEDPIPATLKILFIGNSFTKDAVEHLPGMITAAGINSVKMVHMYYGGRMISEYNNGYESVSDYTCYKANTGWSAWGAYKGFTIKQIVESEKWDVVTIQEHTGKSAAWSWTTAEKDAINGLISKIKASQLPSTPKFIYIISQAYANPDILPSYGQIGVLTSNFVSQQAMYAAIVAQAKRVEAECSVDGVLATGTVLQNLRHTSLNNYMDMTRDGYHMDYGIARYAAACAMFESLVSPSFSNMKLDDNSFRYSTSNTAMGTYSTPVTDANKPVALQAARAALAKPYEVTNIVK